jgi:hypothetical protein
MYMAFGASNWPTNVGFNYTSAKKSLSFTADISTIFVAPYSGSYSFYLNADDIAKVYGSRVIHSSSSSSSSTSASSTAATAAQRPLYGPESVVCYSSYHANDEFYWYTSQRSAPMHLSRGERFKLRIRTVRLINHLVSASHIIFMDHTMMYLLSTLFTVPKKCFSWLVK